MDVSYCKLRTFLGVVICKNSTLVINQSPFVLSVVFFAYLLVAFFFTKVIILFKKKQLLYFL